MISDIVRVFQRVPVIMIAAPLVFVIPALAEGLQHVVEFQAGMYVDKQGMAEAGASQIRLFFGVIKVLALTYVMLWIPRFWFQGKKETSLVFKSRELRILFQVLGFTVVLIAVVFLGGPPLVHLVQASALPVPDKVLPFLPLIILLLLTWPVQHLSYYWYGRFLGDETMTVAHARKVTKGRSNWIMLILFIPIAPLMALHYYLGYHAVGISLPNQIIFLTFDSLLVGVMAIVLGNAAWATYEPFRQKVASSGQSD